MTADPGTFTIGQVGAGLRYWETLENAIGRLSRNGTSLKGSGAKISSELAETIIYDRLHEPAERAQTERHLRKEKKGKEKKGTDLFSANLEKYTRYATNRSVPFFPMSHGLTCWKCGASLEALSLPLRRLDECKACGSELHACRLCVEYDTRVAKHCREPTAEEVRDKTQANFCDHFKPKPGAYLAPSGEADAARAALDALFGKK